MKYLAILAFIALASVAACTKLDLNTEVRVRPKETYYIDYRTSFRIDSLHDYRCPLDLECFWAGDVDIFLSFREGSSSGNLLAMLYSAQHNPVSAGNYRIKILDVLPRLKSTDKFDLNNARIILRIERI